MSLRERIVQVAKEWRGTPFLPGECLKGRGCDCGSLLLGVLREAGVQSLPERSELGAYDYLAPAMRGDGFYGALLERFGVRVAERAAQPGDIAAYRMGRGYSHAAIIVAWPSHVIHADGRLGVVSTAGNEGRLRGRAPVFYRMTGADHA